jgi:hypothetical protein
MCRRKIHSPSKDLKGKPVEQEKKKKKENAQEEMVRVCYRACYQCRDT